MAYLYVMAELVLLIIYRIAMLTGFSLQMIDTGFRVSANILPYLLAHPQFGVPLLAGLILGGVVHSILDLF
jgi:hypothetical protein